MNFIDFKVEYRPGKHSANVYGMTRQPMDTEGDEHSFELLPERQTKDKQKTIDLQVGQNEKLIAAITRFQANKKKDIRSTDLEVDQQEDKPIEEEKPDKIKD